MKQSYSKLHIVIAALVLTAALWAQSGAGLELTLRQAIEQAVQHNLQTRSAQESIAESRAHRGTARSALLPNLSGSAYQASLTENLAALGFSPSTIPGIPAFIGPYNNFDARFQATQSLFDLPALRKYQSAREGVRLAEQKRQLAEQEVTTSTILGYIAVLEAGQSVAAAEANVQLAQRLLDLAANQRNAGIATGLDVVRAETRLAGQQVRLSQAQNSQDTARLNLLRVIGAPLSGRASLSDTMRFEPQRRPEAEAPLQQALANRLELAVAAEQLRIAQTERQAAVAGYAPSVSAFSNYGSSGVKPNELNLPTRSVGVRIDVPIFNGGRTRSEVQASTSRVRQAEMQLEDLRAAVERDVRQALNDLRTREAQMNAARKNLDLAQKELVLSEDRFRNGVADNIEVTNAQTAVENARWEAVSGLAQYTQARLGIYSAIGRVADFTF
jgi:outer membrane protein TolC